MVVGFLCCREANLLLRALTNQAHHEQAEAQGDECCCYGAEEPGQCVAAAALNAVGEGLCRTGYGVDGVGYHFGDDSNALVFRIDRSDVA